MAGSAAAPEGFYRIEWQDGLALVRLTCGKANALNPRSLGAIERALDAAAGGGARGLILTGYDRFFSAGLDLVTLIPALRPDWLVLRPWEAQGALSRPEIASRYELVRVFDARPRLARHDAVWGSGYLEWDSEFRVFHRRS